MATYVIGDIQGCFKPFKALLKTIHFSAQRDSLWLAGDLVNRGPDNLGVLRFCRELGDSAKIILGNHDLHLLAVDLGVRKLGRKDTIQDILAAPDKTELLTWLRHQGMIINTETHCLTHSGVPHIWSCKQAQSYAREVETALRGDHYKTFFQFMYGDSPNGWHDGLEGWERLRVITNYLTRMRFTDPAGRLDFASKAGPEKPPLGMQPWYAYPRLIEDENKTFLFGHWAALEGHTGKDRFQALDTGCVWGGYLTAYRLEDGERFRVNSKA